ncbi:MAG: peptidoglycan-binding protein [Proteobacteria bacterium]|nr:peptidoglycan-binding protein [Pseudomonadota bacterium]
MRHGPEGAGFGALRPGQAIGRFTIEALAGAGAFGTTYRARDMRLGGEVTLREFLPPALATRREGGAAMTEPRRAEEFARGRRHFLNGGRIIAALRAPCIARVLDCVEANGTAYIVAESPPGTTLRARLEAAGPLPPDDVDRILWSLLEGLELVHSRGFFHGDISPDAIVLDSRGRPTLVDFGAAGSVTNTAEAPAYAAPERIGSGPASPVHMTPGNQGPWTDIYGLAATFYCALTGAAPPHASDRLREDRYRPLVRLRPPGFTLAMLAGLDKGLALSMRDRPQSIAQWRSLLWQTMPVVPAAAADRPPLPPARPMAAPIALQQTYRFAATNPAAEPPPIIVSRRPEAGPPEKTAGQTPHEPTPHEPTPPEPTPPEPLPAGATLFESTSPGSPPPRRFLRRALIGGVTILAMAAAALAYLTFAPPPATPSGTTASGTTQAPSPVDADQKRQQADRDAARQTAEAEAAARREEEEARQAQIAAEQEGLRRQQEEDARRQAEAAAQARPQAELADPSRARAAETSLALTVADRHQLQAALAARGFDPKGVDGIFGRRTRQAIAAWQKSRGEPSTGFLSAAQKQALLAAASS